METAHIDFLFTLYAQHRADFHTLHLAFLDSTTVVGMVVSDLYDGRWIRGVWELFLKGYVEEVPCMFVFGLFAVAAEVHREGHGWENSNREGSSRVASCCGNKDSTATQLRITSASHSTSTHDFHASTVMLYYRYHRIEISVAIYPCI